MRLNPGHKLGPYEIVAPIGAGGMGEIYRARDTRLDRTVAIKVMPEGLAANSQLRERFEREAKAISSLAHPNICTLHDVGNDSGVEYLVMEHLEGETLADRLSRGPLPLDDVLAYGVQIADALEKAHRHGIVHRDLKPGNVMLTRTGAKLLDFGLARQSDVVGQHEQTALMTEKKPITEQGTILGTYQYMAPEQLEGMPADARTDIFALGATLYEMTTGTRAFEGKTRTSLIAAIVSGEPRPISQLQPMTPPALARLIRGCLAKDPDERWQSAHDVKLELQTIAAHVDSPETAAKPKRSGLAGWIAAGIVAATAGTWFVADRREHSRPPRHSVFEILPPQGWRFNPIDGPANLSPDGRTLIVKASPSSGGGGLYRRAFDSLEFQPLRGTEGAFDPFWSPDGRQVGFFTVGKLKRLDMATGSSSAICDVNEGRGASWSKNGTILLARSSLGPLFKVPASGGTPVPATKLDGSRKEAAHWRPSFLPDGKRFLFMAISEEDDKGGVYLASLESPEVKRVLDFATPAVYVEPGYLVYLFENDLFAVPFDPDEGRTRGDARLLAREVDYTPQYAAAAFSVSRDGTIVFNRRADLGRQQLQRMPVEGDGAETLPVEGVNLDLSRDGTRVAMMRLAGQQRNPDIWTYDLRRGISTRLTFEAGAEVGPVWSPDGKKIAFMAGTAGGVTIKQRDSAGAGNDEVVLTMSDKEIEVVDWSRDGTMMIAEMLVPNAGMELVLIDLATKKMTPFASSPATEGSARFSPDGKWIAYRSAQSGESQIYVQPFPADGSRWQMSVSGGESPRWSGDSKRLFWVDRDRTLWSADISKGFDALNPQRHRPIGSDDYVLSPDGKQVILAPMTSATPQPIVVLQPAELESGRAVDRQ